MDVHKRGGDLAHVDACLQGERVKNQIFCARHKWITIVQRGKYSLCWEVVDLLARTICPEIFDKKERLEIGQYITLPDRTETTINNIILLQYTYDHD